MHRRAQPGEVLGRPRGRATLGRGPVGGSQAEWRAPSRPRDRRPRPVSVRLSFGLWARPAGAAHGDVVCVELTPPAHSLAKGLERVAPP